MDYELTILGRFVVSTLVGFVIPFALAVAWQKGSSAKEAGAILMALAFVGACAGTAGGMSRDAAVGAIIPAFLGLLGGLSLYIFGIDRSKGLIASFGTAAIALSLITSYTLGAKFRGQIEDHREVRSICAQAYLDHELMGNQVAFDRFRSKMGNACDASMSWWIEGPDRTK